MKEFVQALWDFIIFDSLNAILLLFGLIFFIIVCIGFCDPELIRKDHVPWFW